MLYGSVYVSVLALNILIMEVAIIQNYMSLCYGYYKWWWRTFFYGASIAVCIFAAMTYHLLFEVTIYHTSTLAIYVLFQFMISVSIGLAAGASATIAVFAFNTSIYQKSRED